jgi:hypothetical protein
MTRAINRPPDTAAIPQPPLAPEITGLVDATPAGAAAEPLVTGNAVEAPGLGQWDDAAAAEVARGIILATAAEQRGRRRVANQGRLTANGRMVVAAARANRELRGIKWNDTDDSSAGH